MEEERIVRIAIAPGAIFLDDQDRHPSLRPTA
jgi:hypothetical protein